MSAQVVVERIINVHYHYYFFLSFALLIALVHFYSLSRFKVCAGGGSVRSLCGLP